MVGYVKHFHNSKTMPINATDNRLLRKYKKTWGNVSNLVGIEFDSEPVYGNKYIKSKIRLYRDYINTNFYKKGIPNENTPYKCLSLIMLESAIKGKNKKYYLQTLLDECKYEIKKKKNENYIDGEFDPSSSDESDNESDNEESNESDNEESND